MTGPTPPPRDVPGRATSAQMSAQVMRAVVRERYGEPSTVVRLTHRPVPQPGEGQVLVRVHAAGVNPADLFLTRGRPGLVRAVSGLRRPRQPVLGQDVAGVVASVGPGVTTFAVGDEVYGEGSGARGSGSYAEYACVDAACLAPKPARLSWAEAGALPMVALAAWHGLRTAGVRPGSRVLVLGASGGVGHLAVQLATAMGADVTGVCSTRNLELVRGLGASHVVDYTRTDVTTTGERYDVVLDNVATHRLRALTRLLTPGGVLLMNNGTRGGRVLGPLPRMARGTLLSLGRGRTVRAFAYTPGTSTLVAIKDLVDGGEVTPVVEATYPLERVAEALERVATGHVAGKVVVTVP